MSTSTKTNLSTLKAPHEVLIVLSNNGEAFRDG